MSKYILRRYLSDDSQRNYQIKVLPNTMSLRSTSRGNEAGNRDQATDPFILSRGSRRDYRPVARTVRFKFFPVTPDGYQPNSELTLPVFRKEVFDSFVIGQGGSYRGSQIIVTRKKDESLGV